MITLKKEHDIIIAQYTTRSGDIKWLIDKLHNDEEQCFQKTFTFSQKDVVRGLPPDIEEQLETDKLFPSFGEPDPIDFFFAKQVDDYYHVTKGVITSKFDVYISIDADIDIELFLYESDIPVFSYIDKLIDENVYIGGSHEKAIPEQLFYLMIRQFPNQYEKKLYTEARVASVTKEYFQSTKDRETQFQKYLNRKATLKGENLRNTFHETELLKYITIQEKLQEMLANENGYSEAQWQKEILQIILLLYPKYIKVFTETPIIADELNSKFLDFLLVDADGNVDIIEIKKPFNNAIVTSNVYRNNHIPLRELSGTVMQIEKYIYYLNRWSVKGEKVLTEKYKDQLPSDFKINITNPGALIIMGRDNNLTMKQKRDFEVVKRKYKNVMNIITYDNLIRRLGFIIDQFQKS